ncbi:transposase IS3 [Salmonella enterica subsp. arizonae]|uniref:Transposase IS3 n=1 Tax=Salmonella enterica subsp. arizonae TaxID=59203 RepID=A0A379THG9_SALER|nr:transposase IS3 [Salmonella enterica subsp. arizonae]VDY44693.1 transposase IS3 [Salmonella enterica subsp. arizonae]
MKSATVIAYSTGLNEGQNHWVTLSSKILSYACEPGVSQESHGVLRKAVRLRYAFIRDNSSCWPVRLLCRVLNVHPSGFYAWLQQPHSQRHQVDRRLTGQIKQFWLESGCVYGYRKIHLDLRDSGQQCGVNRVWRLRDKGSGRVPEPAGTQRRGLYRIAQQAPATVQSGCAE